MTKQVGGVQVMRKQIGGLSPHEFTIIIITMQRGSIRSLRVAGSTA